jgi:hypothetical protein
MELEIEIAQGFPLACKKCSFYQERHTTRPDMIQNIKK